MCEISQHEYHTDHIRDYWNERTVKASICNGFIWQSNEIEWNVLLTFLTVSGLNLLSLWNIYRFNFHHKILSGFHSSIDFQSSQGERFSLVENFHQHPSIN